MSSPAFPEFDQILGDENTAKRFSDWFWGGSKGNDLINVLNKNATIDSRIRRHQISPHIYCIVLNDDAIPGKGENGVLWRYCKVGMTEKDTTPSTRNRMEKVMKEIQHKTGKDSSVIFVLPVKATDSRPNSEIEKYVRDRVGRPVDKKKAHSHNFPFPTEWVLTTQPYIAKIKSEIREEKLRDTGLFKSLSFSPTTQPPINSI